MNAEFDTPPKAIDALAPEYPEALRRTNIEGNVVVAFTVDTQGRVHDIEVQRCTNHKLERAAVDAVRRWRFQPALRNGKPVEV